MRVARSTQFILFVLIALPMSLAACVGGGAPPAEDNTEVIDSTSLAVETAVISPGDPETQVPATDGTASAQIFDTTPTEESSTGEEPTAISQISDVARTATMLASTVIAARTQGIPSPTFEGDLGGGSTPAPTLSTEQYTTAIVDLATAQTSPTPIPISVVADQSIAGNADIRAYYNTELAYPNTMRITSELVFRQLAVEPTPFSTFDGFDINTDIDDPEIVGTDTNETPAPARSNERVQDIPFFVIAELDCLETSFIGCGQEQVTRLNLRGINAWHWTIQPLEGISGTQNLTLRLYPADSDGNMLSTRALWEHNFTVNVTSNWMKSVIENNLGATILGVSIIILGVIAYFTFGRSGKSVKRLGVSAFISYKRKGSWGIAEKIHDGLTARGVDTFIDSQDLHEGDFEARLTSEINKRDYVVVVLVPETLSSEWVVKEIAYAFEHGKTVIPVLIEGLKMEDLDIPEEIAALSKQNAVSLYQKYFNAAMDEILVFLKPIK